MEVARAAPVGAVNQLHPNGRVPMSGGPRNQHSPWTLAVVERLIELAADPRKPSAAEISVELSKLRGKRISRSAIIGKCHRDGIVLGIRPPSRRAHTSGLPKRRKWRAARIKPEPVRVIVDHHIPVEQRKSLLELTETTCRWPVGDPDKPGFFFCGDTAPDGQPYCAGHMHRAYFKPRAVSRDQGRAVV